MSDNVAAKKTPSIFTASAASKGKRASGEKKTKQILLILVLIMCCAASGYLFTRINVIDQEREAAIVTTPPLPDAATVAESKEVQDTEASMITLGKASNVVMQTALLAEVSGRLPVAPVSALSKVMPAPPIPLNPLEEPEEPDPPKVTVVAIMIKDRDRVAMVDVEGEDGGLIVRPGSSFSSGTAKITKIDSKGVSFTWMKKSYTIPIAK